MKKLKYILFTLGLIGGLSFVAIVPAVSAADLYQCDNPANSNLPICKDKDKNLTDSITKAVNIILYVLGALAVIMIIVAGIMYALSAGDANAVAKAKGTLLYAIIGLIVALLGYAIVNFVIKAFV